MIKNKLKKWVLSAASVLLLCCVTFSYASTEDNDPVLSANNTSSVIYIGVIYSFNGEFQPFAVPSIRGVDIALHQLNDAGGIDGHPVEAITLNAMSNEDVARDVAQKVAGIKDVKIAIGLNADNMLAAVMPEFVRYNKLFITSGATSDSLPEKYSDHLILTAFTDAMQGNAAASFAVNTLKAKDALVVTDTHLRYAQNVTAAFESKIKALKGKVIYSTGFSDGHLETSKLVQELSKYRDQAQVIYFAGNDVDARNAIIALRKAGFKQAVVGPDGFDAPELVGATDPEIENVYFTTHAVLIPGQTKSETTMKFMNEFKKQYHVYPKSAFSALAYDSVMLAAKAIKETMSTKAASKSDINTHDLYKVLHNLKDFSGASSMISYHDSNIPTKDIYVMKINHGKRELVKTIQS
ncbi:MAG: ABC transporter substrate-binding protein [Pseudomonadota bacterium]